MCKGPCTWWVLHNYFVFSFTFFCSTSGEEVFLPRSKTNLSSCIIYTFVSFEPQSIRFVLIVFFKKIYLFFFRERGREGEREGEKHQCVVVSHAPPIGDLARNPGMCPDWESNRQAFGSQSSTQSTEPHQPGLSLFYK